MTSDLIFTILGVIIYVSGASLFLFLFWLAAQHFFEQTKTVSWAIKLPAALCCVSAALAWPAVWIILLLAAICLGLVLAVRLAFRPERTIGTSSSVKQLKT